METCADKQSEEMVLLQSMYSDTELRFNAVVGEATLPGSFFLRLTIEGLNFEIAFQLPSSYPDYEKPEAFVRCLSSCPINQSQFNADLRTFIGLCDLGAPLVFDIISWITEKVAETLKSETRYHCSAIVEPQIAPTESEHTFSRLYIYSHHLYSNAKRANLGKLGKSLKLTGFYTPGKPCAMVIEGTSKDCKEFWTEVKSWNWQKIVIRHTDEYKDKNARKFDDFEELVLKSSDNKHVQTGEVKTMLEAKGLGEHFHTLYNIL